MADPAQDYFSSLPSPGTPGTPPGVSSSTPASTDAATDYFGSASTQAYHPPANPLDTPAGSEPSDTSDRFTQTDPNDSWLSKGWQQLNKPLTESLLGWGQYREGAGGFERGVEKIASSLTSPLSLLTLAAFAPAGILEGVAGSTLKEALVQGGTKLGEEALTDAAAAANVEKYGAAVQAAKKAQVAGQSIEGAVQQTGMDYGNFRQYGQFLRDNGLKEDDVLGEGLARRVASVGLAKAGFSAERAVAIAKGAETLVNAGFGIDQIHNAVLTLPKATDLLEQGKYDEAAEYITEGAASGLFGVMGIAHGLHSLDTLVPSINTVKDLPLTDASEYLKTIPGMRDVIKGTATAASSALAREHTIEMMNLADVPVSARLKDSAGIGEEAISALHDIFTSKENIKKLQAKQLDMFHAMDTGNDRALAAQLVQSIGWGSHQEDYANQALNGYAAPIRTIENIASENKQQQLDTYNNLLENQKQIAGLGQQIKLLARDFKKATPEERTEIQTRMDALSKQKQAADAQKPVVEEAHARVKEWENPTEETYAKHYRDLNDKLNDAAQHSTSLEEFNEKVRSLGNYPQDLKLIEEKYPEIAKQYGGSGIQATPVNLPETGNDELGSASRTKEPLFQANHPEDPFKEKNEAQLKELKQFLESTRPPSLLPGKGFNIDPEFFEKHKKWWDDTEFERKRAGLLQDIAKNRENPRIGEVRQLPSGQKVGYLNSQALSSINRAVKGLLDFGMSSLHGIQLDEAGSTELVNRLKNRNLPLAKEVSDIIQNSKNEDGTVVLSRLPQKGNKINSVLSTLREEVTHGWQSPRPLSDQALDYLRDLVPTGVHDYLDKNGYDKKPWTRVTEASAKLLAASPKELTDDLKTTPQGAEEFLTHYFKAIEDQHGDQALKYLVHINKLGRQLKEKLYGESLRRQNQTNLASVQAGAGSHFQDTLEGVNDPDYFNKYARSQVNQPQDWRQKFPPEQTGQGETNPTPQEPWQNSPLNSRLPVDYAQQVSAARSTVWKPEQQEYLRRHLDALANVAKGLSPKEAAFLEKLKDADYNNWQNGHSFGLIHSFLDNHIHHIWDLDKNSDFGKSVLLEAQSGSFSKNVQQAKHRTWNLTAEGLLKKLELKNHDPASILESDANHIAEAGANRTVLKTLIKGGLKDSTGMPAVVQRGSGNYDGKSDNLFANPSTIKNVYISPEEVARMTTNGELDTRLKYREVVDQTPQANLDNVGTWIKNTKTQVEKLENKNPLLLDNSPKGGLSDGQHTAAWKQIQTVVQDQATKISDFMDKAVDEIQRTGSFKSPIPPDIALAPYIRKMLSVEKIIPSALDRLSQYGDRMQNYADGANGLGDSDIRPSEIARVLYQEKAHLPPELQSYLQEHHDIFAPEGKSGGEWDKKTITKLVSLVEDAANNKEYPQLIQDLSDLKQVNHLYTSVNPITAKVNEPAATKLLEDINSRQPKKYLWAPKGHIVPDHPSLNNWTWGGKTPDGTNVMVKGDLAISPEFYPYLVNSLGLEKSALRSNEGIGKYTKPILEAGSQAKSVLLSGSPFHMMQIALRGVQLGVNPFVRPNPIADVGETFNTVRGPKKLYELGIKNGATLVQDKKAAAEYSAGLSSHSGLVSRIPIYGPIADQIHNFTFDRLIPSMKADGFKKMFDQYAQRHPDWSDDAVAKHAADHVNNAFGGINWRHMGRSATTQDWFHLVSLAPDWLEAEMRSTAGLLNGVGLGAGKYQPEETKNFSRTQVATVAAGLWTLARISNQLYSGDMHYEAPFGLATKDSDGKTVVYSMRTLPTDVLHLASDPTGFLKGRLSPFVRTGEELYSGRNQYDQKLTDSEKYVDLVSNMVPIPFQSIGKSITGLGTGTDVGLGAQLAKSAGATATVYRTEAQKLAANLASERSEEGAMTPAKIARHRLILKLEDDLRGQKITNEQLETYVDTGAVSEADAKAVKQNVRSTMGEDPELSRMYSRVSRLDLAGAFSVYDASNPSEKQALQKLITKKAQTYVKSARTKLTPQERQTDPAFLRARKLVSQNEEAPNE